MTSLTVFGKLFFFVCRKNYELIQIKFLFQNFLAYKLQYHLFCSSHLRMFVKSFSSLTQEWIKRFLICAADSCCIFLPLLKTFFFAVFHFYFIFRLRSYCFYSFIALFCLWLKLQRLKRAYKDYFEYSEIKNSCFKRFLCFKFGALIVNYTGLFISQK